MTSFLHKKDHFLLDLFSNDNTDSISHSSTSNTNSSLKNLSHTVSYNEQTRSNENFKINSNQTQLKKRTKKGNAKRLQQSKMDREKDPEFWD